MFLLLFTVTVVGIAYAIEDPLYTAGNVEKPHTHAFDTYSNPFRPGVPTSRLPARSWQTLRDSIQLYEAFGLAGVGCLLVIGAALQKADPDERVEAWLTTESRGDQPETLLSAQVPGPVLGAVAIAGLVALSVVGCFVYYPAPEETLEDLKIVRAEALAGIEGREPADVAKDIERYDGLIRKLQVGYYLRHGAIDERQRLRCKALLGWLEQLKDVVEAGEYDRVRGLSSRIFKTHRRVAETFRPE